jgi:cell division protein FtsI/penicillin-binding protein 2
MLKVKLMFLFFLLAFGAVIVKLFYIQILNAHTLAGEYVQTRRIYPERGKILDRNARPLAVNETKYLLFVEPKKIERKDYLASDLDKILKIGEATIEARIDESKDWVRVHSGVTKEMKDAITRLNLAGVGFDEERERYYPEASLSAHILGFVGKNSEGENLGYFGIEGYYDKELTGLTGLLKTERDLIGRPIFFGTQEKVDSQDGGDLILTIDGAVQALVKKKLLTGIEQYEAKEGCVIVADPYTMEIFSMVCLPDFDPEKYYEFDGAHYKNPAISNLYEPGSTFKPLIVAAGIEEKAIKPDETFQETGAVTVGEYKIKTWNDKYEGTVSMTRILEKSSNVGMVYIGDKLGGKKLYEYLDKYGLGEATSIDLQGEVSIPLKPESQWSQIDYATATFGQGIAVTPIQMVKAFASIINGGKLLRPHVVKQIINNDIERKQDPVLEGRTVSERTSQIIKKMLVSTVENGEISWLKPKGFTMGGKTGTAQIPIQGHYDPTKTIASFIGFAPADKPKFIALVVLREPGTSPWGSETAAPLFFEIAKELLLYYNIAPDKND